MCRSDRQEELQRTPVDPGAAPLGPGPSSDLNPELMSTIVHALGKAHVVGTSQPCARRARSRPPTNPSAPRRRCR